MRDENSILKNSKLKYDGFLTVVEETHAVKKHDNTFMNVTREVLVSNKDAVGVILVDYARGKFLLVKQWRVGVGYLIEEIVAGYNEQGETLIDAAKREAQEETGLDNITIVSCIGSYFTSPGRTTEEVTLFVGTYDSADIKERHIQNTNEQEDILLCEHDFLEARQLEVADMKTRIAIDFVTNVRGNMQ